LSRFEQPLEGRDHVRFAAGEVIRQLEAAAEVELVAIRKGPSAVRALP
jgi:hypothetical protein